MSVRLKLALSYAGLLMLTGAVLLAVVWVFLLRYVPHDAIVVSALDVPSNFIEPADLFIPGRYDLWRAFAPKAGAAMGFLLVFGLVGGWFLAGRMLAPLARITDATRLAATGSLSHRIQLEGRSDEFRELADAFDAMLARLETHVAEQQRFAANASHELRTPLTTLSLAIQLYDRQASMTPALADITRTGIAQLQALVDRVLAFDLGLAPPAAEQSPPIMPVRLLPLLEEIIESYQPIASAKGVYFDMHVPPELTGVAHIPSLGRALHEVVDNAVRYSEGGRVTLAAQLHDGHALLSISDEGPGIPYEERDRLFEAFYRGSGARALSATPGTGLGLSIARRDIEALGGRIWLEESSPHGSTICVAIPAASLDDVPVYEGLRERLVNA
ncbi:hypothetical protein SE17_11470 [Kouleothrix aurantiaca]|uniref:Signal transduction histidine-protein kinase/phosphatase MprB n=1 Tax=Kouleothrix aurantiaca TaxID=186479 RepID=A0A0P9D5J4_9CHLR|nr:hypothetical protein SE17_11470 [Kouleothrix aurantiaca]